MRRHRGDEANSVSAQLLRVAGAGGERMREEQALENMKMTWPDLRNE